FVASRRRHTRSKRDWSSDVCSSDLGVAEPGMVDDADLLRHGLTGQQVHARTTSGLVNVQPEDSSRSLATILRTHLLSLFNLVIFLCAVGIILMGRWLDLLFAIAGVSNIVIGV